MATTPAPQGPLNFPTSPTVGEEYNSGGLTYTYQSWGAWKANTSGGGSIEVGPNPPANPNNGDMWWNSLDSEGVLYVWYDTIGEWIQTVPTGATAAAGGGGGGNGSIGLPEDIIETNNSAGSANNYNTQAVSGFSAGNEYWIVSGGFFAVQAYGGNVPAMSKYPNSFSYSSHSNHFYRNGWQIMRSQPITRGPAVNKYYIQLDENGQVDSRRYSPYGLDDADVRSISRSYFEVTEDVYRNFSLGGRPKRYVGPPVDIGITDYTSIQTNTFTTYLETAPYEGQFWNGSAWEYVEDQRELVGIISTGRGRGSSSDNDLAPSAIFLKPDFDNLLDVSDLELFIPSNSTVVPYDATLNWPWQFDTVSPAFNGTDFELQVRIAATSQIIAEVEVPVADVSNQRIDLRLYE